MDLAIAGFATFGAKRDRRVVFVAHPVGNGADREENIRNAKSWIIWLAEQGYAPFAPWLTLVEAWTENRREQGIAINLRVLSVCQGVVLCGGRISPGMQHEIDAAQLAGIPILDLTPLGYDVPGR